VRSYRTISPLPPISSQTGRHGLGGVFLWHFPWGRPRRALPGTVPPWSPDFPPSGTRRAAIRPSGMGKCGIAPPPGQTERERRRNFGRWATFQARRDNGEKR
jgi:hypothetical protein